MMLLILALYSARIFMSRDDLRFFSSISMSLMTFASIAGFVSSSEQPACRNSTFRMLSFGYE